MIKKKREGKKRSERDENVIMVFVRYSLIDWKLNFLSFFSTSEIANERNERVKIEALIGK